MNPRYSRYYTFIKPILRNKVVRTYSSLIFSLIAILIFSIFAIRPTVSTILVLNKQVEEQQAIYNKLLEKEKKLSIGNDNLNKIAPDTKSKIDTLLPGKTDVTTITQSLVNLATQDQASISGLQIQPTQLTGETINQNPSLRTVSFTINLLGSYQTLISTLQSFKLSPRLISVDTVNISQVGDNLIMSINAKAYFLQ